MNKKVYLFELDSVRNTKAEILKGQQALFEETVTNGNVVVMSYNQFMDSKTFLNIINQGQEEKEALMDLFHHGFLKLSQYGPFRTAARYVLNAVEKNLSSDDGSFILSAIPVKGNQKYLLGLLKRSIMYSDLTEIEEYLPDGTYKSADRRNIIQLFSAFDSNGAVIPQDTLNEEDCIQNLKTLHQFIEMILDISSDPIIYNQPKKTSEYNNLLFINILTEIIFNIKFSERSICKPELWDGAVGILKNINASIQGKFRNERSSWHNKLKLFSQNDKTMAPQFAEEIVDLCYNYAVELSIYNVSRHYDIQELQKYAGSQKEIPSEEIPTFCCDFITRLNQHWNMIEDKKSRYLREEGANYQPITDNKHTPDWKFARDILKVTDYKKNRQDSLNVYEYQYKKQKKGRAKWTIEKTLKMFILFLWYTVIGIMLECVLGEVQDQLSTVSCPALQGKFLGLLVTGFWIWIFVVFVPKVTTWLQQKFNLRALHYYGLEETSHMLGVIIRHFFCHKPQGEAYVNADMILFEESHPTKSVTESMQEEEIPVSKSASD